VKIPKKKCLSPTLKILCTWRHSKVVQYCCYLLQENFVDLVGPSFITFTTGLVHPFFKKLASLCAWRADFLPFSLLAFRTDGGNAMPQLDGSTTQPRDDDGGESRAGKACIMPCTAPHHHHHTWPKEKKGLCEILGYYYCHDLNS
jgi:hypothetical protein